MAAALKGYREAWLQLHGAEPAWLMASSNLQGKALAILMLHDQPLLESLFHHRPHLWNSPTLTDLQHSLWSAFIDLSA